MDFGEESCLNTLVIVKSNDYSCNVEAVSGGVF